ncbi:MAG: hypothetical protein QMC37_10360 [Flavobacteriales bacterium]
MSKRTVSFAISFILLSLNSISAQTSFFTPTLSDYKSSGWTLSLGISGLGGSHSPFEDEILLANTSSASIDTAYSGTWTPDGGIHLTGGIGKIFVVKRPLLADRITVGVSGSRRSISETFHGRIAEPTLQTDAIGLPIDSSITGAGQSINLGIHCAALRAFTLSQDVFLELGIGATFRCDFDSDFEFISSTPLYLSEDSGFGAESEISPYSASFEIRAGAGIMMWRGRYLRIQFGADILQLAPINATSKLPWLVGNYRPYRVMLHWDLFGLKPPKPAGSCAAPTHSEKAKELFGKDMRKGRKTKKRKNKRG